jgi:6-pyruvoyltetrahydropterin/6-carboxytetrahydropterin synthase
MADFSVRVIKDYLVFGAAHFVTYADECERLHGHNYRVAATLEGPLNDQGYVHDFTDLKRLLREIVDELDHMVILPTRSTRIKVERRDGSVHVDAEGRRYMFPAEDCLLLDIANTTAELLAAWIANRLIDALHQSGAESIEAVAVEVEESFGQAATCRQALS